MANKPLKAGLEEVLRLLLLIWCHQSAFKHPVPNHSHKIGKPHEHIETYRKAKRSRYPKDECDKTVVVSRASGEFGFRIHGSRPVVVSAIEPGTPAETSGLEIGDIVIAINGVNVLDSSHAEVVRIAHSGSDVLKLDVARTSHVLTPVTETADGPDEYGLLEPIHTGYLYRKSDPSAGDRSWHKRWFCLRGNRCLYFYKNEKDNQPIGALCVTGCTIETTANGSDLSVSEGENQAEMPFRFTVYRTGSNPHKLAACSNSELQLWLDALHAASDSSPGDGWVAIQRQALMCPPSEIKFPDCFGYLSKLGHRWRAWRRRYCVLKDAAVFFYADTSATSALGVACLHGYRVQSSSVGGKKHAFELIPPDEQFRHFFFYTDSDTDKKRWIAALEFSIDRWLKVT